MACPLEAGERAGVPQSILGVLRRHWLRLCVSPTMSPAFCPGVFGGSTAAPPRGPDGVEGRQGPLLSQRTGGVAVAALGLWDVQLRRDLGAAFARARSRGQEPAGGVLECREDAGLGLDLHLLLRRRPVIDRQMDRRAPPGGCEPPQARREGYGLPRAARALAVAPVQRAQRAHQLDALPRGAPGAEGQLGDLEARRTLGAGARPAAAR